MKTKKQLEKKIEKVKKGCGKEPEHDEDSLVLDLNEGVLDTMACGKNNKFCQDCGIKGINLQATLTQTNEIIELIENRIKIVGGVNYSWQEVVAMLKELLTKIKGDGE